MVAAAVAVVVEAAVVVAAAAILVQQQQKPKVLMEITLDKYKSLYKSKIIKSILRWRYIKLDFIVKVNKAWAIYQIIAIMAMKKNNKESSKIFLLVIIQKQIQIIE